MSLRARIYEPSSELKVRTRIKDWWIDLDDFLASIIMVIGLVAGSVGIACAIGFSIGGFQHHPASTTNNIDQVNRTFYDHCHSLGGYAQIGDVNVCVKDKSNLLDQEDNHVQYAG